MAKKFKGGYDSGFDDQPDWNFIVGYFKLLVNRMDVIDAAASNGDLLAWYRGLKTFYREVRDTIRLKTFGEEHEKFKKFDLDVVNRFSLIAEALSQQYGSEDKNLSAQATTFNLSRAERMLDKLNTIIYSELHNANVIYPPQREQDWEAEERQSYPE